MSNVDIIAFVGFSVFTCIHLWCHETLNVTRCYFVFEGGGSIHP